MMPLLKGYWQEGLLATEEKRKLLNSWLHRTWYVLFTLVSFSSVSETNKSTRSSAHRATFSTTSQPEQLSWSGMMSQRQSGWGTQRAYWT